ncbi:PREDICTED: SWI/SNF-related matrix-associated actin-dependent regulator of chromatin subfamily D member 3-like isoform X2 [Gavialis gangeticus]|uniref:SWI/SNF-related matrix-associated actin-dependent regulator of chromatin subfamily D member 3-like isoform X2 n=1 Tax=Gavialis gangeticus TaxID=94835 RepID=UPI00092EA553|nr:PREDICTED: SWI/SNF-related matrix-associated actin-dependent regulator of chromatin subfamily D member 3-like isoform X2 [Gavialis gangeticus]
MATDEVAGGARKATKSKLFEFLVHGVRPGMPSGARMPHQGAPMGPPGPAYVGSPSVRPGMPQAVMEPTRKRTAPQQVQQQQVQQQVQQQQQQQATQSRTRSAKRRKMADKILPQRGIDQNAKLYRPKASPICKHPSILSVCCCMLS